LATYDPFAVIFALWFEICNLSHLIEFNTYYTVLQVQYMLGICWNREWDSDLHT